MDLRRAIKESEFTFKEIAEQLGIISSSTVTNWCTGQTPVPDKYKKTLSSILGVPTRDLDSIKVGHSEQGRERRLLFVKGKWRTILECSLLEGSKSVRTIQRNLNCGFSDEESVFPSRVSMDDGYPHGVNREVEYNGVTINLREWSMKKSIPLHRLYARAGYGWSVEEVLFLDFNPIQTKEYRIE